MHSEKCMPISGEGSATRSRNSSASAATGAIYHNKPQSFGQSLNTVLKPFGRVLLMLAKSDDSRDSLETAAVLSLSDA